MFLTSFWVMPTAKDPHAYLDVRHAAEIRKRSNVFITMTLKLLFLLAHTHDTKKKKKKR